MFKSKSTKNHEQVLALMGLLGSMTASIAGGKGKGAERMEAMAQVVAALGFSPESIQAVEIDWKTVKLGDADELVPVLRMTAVDGSVKAIEQIER